MNSTITDIELNDILPNSIKNDSNVSASGKAIDPQLQTVSGFVDYPILLKRIDSLTSVQLDHLARQYDATWRDSWGISLKRSVLKATIANKRIVGTVKAVRNALDAISTTLDLKEWWQETPMGDPHTFTVVATMSDVSGGTSVERQEDLIAQIESAKPVRSWYTLKVNQALRGGFNAVGRVQTVILSRISHI